MSISVSFSMFSLMCVLCPCQSLCVYACGSLRVCPLRKSLYVSCIRIFPRQCTYSLAVYRRTIVGNCAELLLEYIYECQSDAIIPFAESNAATVEDNDYPDNGHDNDDRGWKLDEDAPATAESAAAATISDAKEFID